MFWACELLHYTPCEFERLGYDAQVRALAWARIRTTPRESSNGLG